MSNVPSAMLDADRTQLQIALGAHRAGRIQEAGGIYSKLYAVYPRDFDVVHLYGLSEFQSGHLERGAALLCEAVALKPNSAAAHNNLGNIRKAQGRLSDAVESFGRALSLKPDYPEALVNRSSAGLALGRFAEALADCDAALKLVPGSPEARLGRGLALKELKRLPESLAAFDAVLAVRPQDAETLSNKANVLLDLGRPDEAVVALRNAVRLKPSAPGLHFNLGNATLALGEAVAALDHYDRVIDLAPRYAEAYGNRGNALVQLARLPEALASYDKAISLKPDYTEAHNNRGNALKEMGRPQEALESYDAAIGLNRGYAEAYSNRGIALKELNRPDEALAAFECAIDLNPDYAEAHSNRANLLADLGRLDDALASYSLAINLKPGHAEIYCDRGNALAKHMRLADAVASYDEAIKLKPNFAEAHANRGDALKKLKRLDEALASFEMAISLKPDIEYLAGNLLHVKMRVCDWTGLTHGTAAVAEALRQGRKVIYPWISLGLFDDPELQLAAAHIYTQADYPPVVTATQAPRKPGAGKIRVGYFSSDFGDHAVSHLTAELFESHDRQHFDVHAFSFGPGKSGAMYDRISSAFGGIHDLNGRSDHEAVALSRQLGIDIAVNLNGFTDHQRTGLFQKRCAPIQVNYLGYPGTMGASYMDYIIADRVLIPEEEQTHYAEKTVDLPGSFQANDSQRRISDRLFTRAECGLPGSGFVFCCFNGTYKITPAVFDAWMRILGRVPGSVLWLYAENGQAPVNLRAEAIARGIDPARLVFAEKVRLEDYLARYKVAGLFLDTLPYNAGTTASDALWAGLPVLTCCGRSFAGRMAASLLTAVDLQELIASDLQRYEELAVALALNTERLQAIRERLARNRSTTSLFNGKTLARNMEAAFRQMVERDQQRLPPTQIQVY